MAKKTIRVSFDLPVEIEQGNAGLVYVSSRLIRGLFIAEATEDEALRMVPDVLAALAKAAAS
jgi:hypothetical protein